MENYGLYNGKMGLCILEFHKSSLSNKKVQLYKARNLLNEISDNIASLDNYSFDDGLLGIGWSVEYLYSMRYINVDTHDVLYNLDDEVYKNIMHLPCYDLGLEKGLLGKLLYLYKRLTSQSAKMDFYRELVIVEVLIFQISELKYHLSKFKDKIHRLELTTEDINVLSKALHIISMLKVLKISPDVEELLKDMEQFLIKLVNCKLPYTEIAKFETLIWSFHNAGKLLNNKNWQRKSKEILIKFQRPLNHSLSVQVNFRDNLSIWSELMKISEITNDYSWCEGWLRNVYQ